MSSNNLNYKNIFNSRSNNLKLPKKLFILKEGENLLYQMKKNRFASKVSITELDLTKKESLLNKVNIKHNQNNQKILNQIQSLSNKIYENNSQDKKRKMLDDLLFPKPKYYKNYLMKDNNSTNNIEQRNLFKLSSPQKEQIYYNNKYDYDYDNKKENSFSIINYNPEDKNKKCFYIIKQDKSKEKIRDKNYLPPINKFKYKYHKIKLKVNNTTGQNEEENMIKLFKALEFQKKHKFVL